MTAVAPQYVIKHVGGEERDMYNVLTFNIQSCPNLTFFIHSMATVKYFYVVKRC